MSGEPTADGPGAAGPERAAFTPAEEQAVREAYASGGHADCPRCGTAMTARAIGGGSFGLGYARRREWLICASCRRSVIFDLRRGTRN
jgi:transposase-like protein